MIRNIMHLEFKNFVADPGMLVSSILLLLLISFGAYNGKIRVDNQQEKQKMVLEEHKKNVDHYTQVLQKVESGEPQDLKPWANPQNPVTTGRKIPLITTFPHTPLSWIATGQSDIYVAINSISFEQDPRFAHDKFSNPVQQLFGNFDLAFVLVYLIPLIVIALSYNIISAEREQGTLKLVLSQPVTLTKWLFVKLVFRFSVIFSMIVFCILIILPILDLSFSYMDTLLLLLLTGIYISLYFFISLLVNLFSRHSGTNAVILVSIWVFFVMIFPATIGLFATTLYPVPSRVKQLSEMRSAEKEAKEEGSKLLASFYEDHPELAVLEAPNEDEALKRYNTFWKTKYVVSKDIEEHTQPIIKHHAQQIQLRRDLSGILRFFSPAILYQESLNEIAGTSSRHYLAYQQQVQNFYDTWRKTISEKTFRNQKMTKKDLSNLPQFTLQTNLVKKNLYVNTVMITIYAVILLLLGILLRKPVDKMI
ncbi:DUF3526 domain-containing protein [Candidatus Uabimicrobium amorphum]|uniref:ABC transporter permease n=1 Tax=Uabimicrobium amorphum TaxID=2596890 RepID=A0A5S9IJR2_UABAM|nr:DUF3526 domain-containing protein [Candidatus Uabimicrobium amorphum]BBM83128.1 hypothetical protein UABAM_01479 [Candidatus Uabimicrobium amorphum]